MKNNIFNIGAICSILVLFSVIAFTGCKKDDPSNTDRLSDKDFKLTAATIDPAITIDGNPVTDYYTVLPACSKDNTRRFNKEGTYTDNEGTLKCSPSAPQTTTGTWVWNSDETYLITTDNSGIRNLKIIKNDGSALIVSTPVTIDGNNYTYTSTYTKQ